MNIILKKHLTKQRRECIIIKHSLRGVVKYRGVEQLVARRAHNPKVVGSSPSSATKSGTTIDTICVDSGIVVLLNY